jgi:hypothetical protein
VQIQILALVRFVSGDHEGTSANALAPIDDNFLLKLGPTATDNDENRGATDHILLGSHQENPTLTYSA